MTKEKVHYIVALPWEGLPRKIKRVINALKRKHQRLYTTIYYTEKTFWVRGKTDVREPTNYWMEISDAPLEIRTNTEWPLRLS